MQRLQRGGSHPALVALDVGIDMRPPVGGLIANVMASVAEWERRVIGERTAAVFAARRAAGVTLGPRDGDLRFRQNLPPAGTSDDRCAPKT